jgi:hypothetical protein
MQMKIGRWEGLYPRIQSAAKHIRCGFVCGYRKIAGRSGRNGARSLVLLNRVYTVLTQARTGPPRRSESNERVDGERVCASFARSIMQPCVYLERTNDNSFRGSISGLGFAYCDFTRYQGRTDVDQPARHGPLSVTADK